jgi:hypothetical protein
MNFNATWTPDDIGQIFALKAQGLTASAIAARIGKGSTRNAIIGVIHRHRMKNGHIPGKRPKFGEGKPSSRREVTDPPRPSLPPVVKSVAPRPVLKPLPRVISPPPTGIGVPLLELAANGCRYAIKWETGQHLFCNAAQKENSPYCKEHHDRCNLYVPLSRVRP